MTVDQYRALQQRAADVQRFALDLFDLGFAKEGVLLSQAAIRILKMKPAKQQQQKLELPAPNDAQGASAARKGKGA